MKLHLRKKYTEIPSPAVMGVLNVTPDSFSDGGLFLSIDDALKQVQTMISAGADIIDVGGESTRPGAERLSVDEEIDRIIPAVERIKKEFEVLVSIDTYKERVARIAVTEAGADMVNDISGLGFSENMALTISNLDVPVVVMHIQGSPENMQKNPFYTDVIAEIKQYFSERIHYALSKGIKKEKIIIDPGIGFGKRFEDNIKIIKRLSDFKEFDCPILIGLSRKTFLGEISGEKIPRNREVETLTANAISILNGASIIRVHHVRNAVRSIRILRNLVDLES